MEKLRYPNCKNLYLSLTEILANFLLSLELLDTPKKGGEPERIASSLREASGDKIGEIDLSFPPQI